MRFRYPGARPFEFDQQHIFFGRNKDIDNLYRFVKLETVVVLYGKSGTGKSSLINAGIIPRAVSDGYFETVRVRFKACPPGGMGIVSPLETTLSVLRQITPSEPRILFLEKLIPDENSMWLQIKKFQLAKAGNRGILLLFDQFEELFTYPDEDILEFRKQLSEAIFMPVPQRFWDVLEHDYDIGDENMLTTEQLTIFQQAPDVKLLPVIRSDRIHLLHQLTDYFPSILKKCFELGPLDKSSAEEAMLGPAGMEGDFSSPPFNIHKEALELIIQFLTSSDREKIETTQLQIICNYLEERVIQYQLKNILPKHISDLDDIISHYYFDKIHQISDYHQQTAARLLIEEGLLFEEEDRRLSLYEGQIYRVYDLQPQTLQELVDSHLLRAEPSLQGGYTYELSHDSLVGPVLAAKHERREAERKQAEEILRKSRERELALERRKRVRAIRVAFAFGILTVLSLFALVFAGIQFEKAKASETEARRALGNFLTAKRANEALAVHKLLQEAEILANIFKEDASKPYALQDAIRKLVEADSILPNDPGVRRQLQHYRGLLKGQ